MAIHKLLSRGIEAARQHGNHDLKEIVHEIPTFAMIMVALTIIGYFLVNLHVHYTYGIMMPNLVVTEAPQTTTVIKTTEYRDEVDDEAENPDAPLLTKEEKESLKPRDEEVLIINHKPLTAKFRTAIKHLREKTGTKASVFQGLGGWIIYTLCLAFVDNFTYSLTRGPLCLLRIPINASLCLLGAAWIQSTLAMPKQRGYFKLVGDLRRAGHFKILFFSSMLVNAAEMFTASLPRSVMISAHGIDDLLDGKHRAAVMGVGSALSVFLTLFFFTTAVIPLNIGIVRLAASFLPEELETVIPIDRTLNMAERKTLKSAWGSFSREGCWRLLKTYIKVGLIQFAVTVVAFLAVVTELTVFAKPQLNKAVEQTMQAYRK